MNSCSFWISLLSILYAPLFFPKIHVLFFAPYLILCFYRSPRSVVLWKALAAGVIVDLLSSHTFFGITSINYCIVSLVLFGQTRNFFEDKASTLPLMTFLFSLLSSFLSAALSLIFSRGFRLNFHWVLTDLAAMPLIDSAYAFLFFSLPFQITRKLTKMRLKG